MAIVGLGTDICDIRRIQASSNRLGEKFAQRILTPTELAIFQQAKDPSRYLAKRFAVKEAAAKALGTGIAAGVSFQHFEVSNTSLGKPKLCLSDKALVIAQTLGMKSVHVSISDEVDYAMATVILES